MATPEPLSMDIARACGLVVHDVGGAGPIYGAAATPAGWRYFSDQFHHRIIIQTPGGSRRFVGRPGDGAGEFRFPRGLAVYPAETPSGTRLFVCDAWNHRIQVFDGEGRPVGAFGRPGRDPGEFDVPSDIAVVRPERPGTLEDQEDPLIAVADRWNSRVQIFETDGRLVTSIGDREGKPLAVALTGVSARAGWPLFRVVPDPACWFPTRLRWHAPTLEIVGANDRSVSIDLAAALLPDFGTWLDQADADALNEAAELFRTRAGTSEAAPGELLAAVETRLGSLLATAGSPVGAARVWARPWPADITADQVEENVADRARAVTDAWLHSGGSTGISRLAGGSVP